MLSGPGASQTAPAFLQIQQGNLAVAFLYAHKDMFGIHAAVLQAGCMQLGQALGKLSAEVVTLLADQGRGLVTFDRGLNAADQVARREGLPTVTIYRSLDDEGEEAPLIRRYLDRAAFKAAQEGQVVVIGSTRADTITALMEWTVEGRAASVVLAPISALMQDQ